MKLFPKNKRRCQYIEYNEKVTTDNKKNGKIRSNEKKRTESKMNVVFYRNSCYLRASLDSLRRALTSLLNYVLHAPSRLTCLNHAPDALYL